MTRPSFRPLLAALAAGSILAGCVSGPDFERPDAPSATAYRSPSDPAGTPAPGPAAQAGQGPALRWWTAFGSADLDALVARAIANNYSLAASNATLRASIEEVNAAAGKRLPQVDANARVEREQPNLAAFGFESDTGNPEFNLYSEIGRAHV